MRYRTKSSNISKLWIIWQLKYSTTKQQNNINHQHSNKKIVLVVVEGQLNEFLANTHIKTKNCNNLMKTYTDFNIWEVCRCRIKAWQILDFISQRSTVTRNLNSERKRSAYWHHNIMSSNITSINLQPTLSNW